MKGGTVITLAPLCRCGHGRTDHYMVNGLDPHGERGACFGKVDKRPLAAGGDLSPCDCLKYDPVPVTFGV